MARNAILLLSTLALFGALFLGYLVVVQDPVLDAGGDSPEILPVDRGRAGEALRLPGVEVPRAAAFRSPFTTARPGGPCSALNARSGRRSRTRRTRFTSGGQG